MGMEREMTSNSGENKMEKLLKSISISAVAGKEIRKKREKKLEIAWIVGYDYPPTGRHHLALVLMTESGRIIRKLITTTHPRFYLDAEVYPPTVANGILQRNGKASLVHKIDVERKKDPYTDEERVFTAVYTHSPSFVSNRDQSKNVSIEFAPRHVYNNHVRYQHVVLNENGYHMGYPYLATYLEGDVWGRMTKLEEYNEGVEEYRELYKEVEEGMNERQLLLADEAVKLLHAKYIDASPLVIAFDIEAKIDFAESLNPFRAGSPISSIAVTTNEETVVFVLDEKTLGNGSKIDEKKFRDGTYRVVKFRSEKELLEAFNEKIEQDSRPIIVTYNGDGFDLVYLKKRMDLFKIKNNIELIGKNKREATSKRDLLMSAWKGKIHIDLYQHFQNNSIKIYAYGDKYENMKLDTVAEAIIGKRKYNYEGELSKLGTEELAFYNAKDAQLTFELATHNDSYPFRIMMFAMRFGNLTLEEACRAGISKWWAGYLYRVLSKLNYVYPNDNKETNTDKIKGGFVFSNIKGVHRDVTVYDAPSLYPTIMMTKNIGFSTMNCSHEECKKDTFEVNGHKIWICKKRRGFIPDIIQFFREARVKIYKPKKMQMASFLKVFINSCQPADTKILTVDKKGQIIRKTLGEIHEEFQRGESVAVYGISPHFDNLVFTATPVLNTVKISPEEHPKLIKIETGYGYTTVFSPDHLTYVFDKHSSSLVPKMAKDVKVGDLVPTAAKIPKFVRKGYVFLPELFGKGVLYFESRLSARRFSFFNRLKTGTDTVFIRVEDLSEEELREVEKDPEGVMYKTSDRGRNDRALPAKYVLTEPFFRLAGWYVSEGSVDQRKTLLYFPQNRGVRKNRIYRIAKELVPSDWIKITPKSINVYSHTLTRLFIKLFGDNSYNKRIPLEYFDAETAAYFLEEYVEGDGNISGANIRCVTASEQLADDLILLFRMVGDFASKRRKGKYWRIAVTRGKMVHGMLDHLALLRVNKVEEVKNEGELIDMTTATGNYLTESYLLTKNCFGVMDSIFFDFRNGYASEAITYFGRKIITTFAKKVEELGGKVIYGDSVTGDTPIIVKERGVVKVMGMDELWRLAVGYGWARDRLGGKEYLFAPAVTQIEIMGRNGFTPPRFFVRHFVGWEKELHEVYGSGAIATTTTDHQFLLEDGSLDTPLHFTPNTPLVIKGFSFNQAWNYMDEGGEGVEYLFKQLLGLYGKTKRTRQETAVFVRVPAELENSVKKIVASVHTYGAGVEFTKSEDERFFEVYFKNTKGLLENYGDVIGGGMITELERLSAEELMILVELLLMAFPKHRPDTNAYLLNTAVEAYFFSLVMNAIGEETVVDVVSRRDGKYYRVFIGPLQRKEITVSRRKGYDGYVYDINTDDGFFSAGGFIVHNTDSVFTQHVTEEMARKASKMVGVEMENEGFWDLFISYAKKNYLLKRKDGKYKLKGMVGKKKNVPPIIRRAFAEAVEIIDVEKSVDEIMKDIVSVLKKYTDKLLSFDFAIEDVSVSQALSKDLDKYKTDTQLVTVVKNFRKETGMNDYGSEGVIVDYVKVVGRERWKHARLVRKDQIDVAYYVEQLYSVFGQLLEPFEVHVKKGYRDMAKGQTSIEEFLS